jgi:hypothetical protein
MNKNIVKLTESNIKDIVGRVIAEQISNDESIVISGELGQKNNDFAGLKVFVEELISKVNKKLRGDKPYIIRILKKATHSGISMEHNKSGDDFQMKINFIPVEEKDRYYYFTCSAAIYSEAVSFPALDTEAVMRASRKTDSWPAEKIYSLGMDLFNLESFENLNIAEPNRKYQLLFKYLAGTKPPQDKNLPNQTGN